jgi:hypothetical protein
LKRSLFGYRRSLVDEELAGREASLAECGMRLAELRARLDERRQRVGHLEGVCDQLSKHVVARERDLEALDAELEPLRAEGNRATEALLALADELEGVRAQARGQATRIRLRALRDAADLSGRITECARRPVEAREGMLAAIQEALERIGVEADEPEPVDPRTGFAVRPAAEMFDGLVEIEVGPLHDFSQLVGFEDAAGGITATSEISVKRFAQGRATLEMKLAEPVELLHELEQRSPFEFRVRDRRFDRLVLDVGVEAA